MTLSRQQRRLQERMAGKKHGYLSFVPSRTTTQSELRYVAKGGKHKGVITGRTSARGDTPGPHPKKGQFKGACNKSACQKEHDPEMGIEIQWYNRGSLAWYCGDCAMMLSTDPFNRREAERLWGPGAMLCVRCDNEEDKANYPF